MPSLGSADAEVPPARDKRFSFRILPPRRWRFGRMPPSEGIYALVTHALVTHALVTYALVTYALVTYALAPMPSDI